MRTLHYIFDWDLAIRYSACWETAIIIDEPLAKFRLHASSKTVKEQQAFHAERLSVLRKLAETHQR